MGESVSAELRERARLRRVQGADYVTVEEIRDWLAAEARASDHPFVRRVTAGTLAELDDARARVAELEVENERLRAELRKRPGIQIGNGNIQHNRFS